MRAARKDSWKTKPMPQESASLNYRAEFSSVEFDRMCQGLIPQEMEDKWFVFFDGTTLHVHRSWTGFCIYQVTFAEQDGKHAIAHAVVNRSPAQWPAMDQTDDVELLDAVLTSLLLAERAPRRA